MLNEKISRPFTADTKTIHLWAVGGIADYMLYLSFNALIQPVFTTTFKLSPVLVGWALMLPRLSDAIVDPLVGHFSDTLQSRWGRRRPFIALTAVLGAVSVIAMWLASPDWGPGAQFLHLLVCSVLLYFCFGTFDMTHMALGYELSDDYSQRSRVVAVRSFYFAMAAVGGGWAYWFALRPMWGGELNGVRAISIGMAALILVFGLIPVVACGERFRPSDRKHVNFFQAAKTVFAVKPFVLLLLVRVAQTLGGSLYGAFGFYIGVYIVCRGEKSTFTFLSGLAGIVGVVCAFLLMPLSARLTHKLGKRRGILVGLGASLLSALLLPIFNQTGHPYLLLAHMLLFVPTNLMLAMFLSSIIPDICDLDELATGQRREGMFSAVMSFVGKVENSIVILLGGYLLAFSGYDANLPVQPMEVLHRMKWLGFTPAIVFSAVALLVAWKIPMSEQYMSEVRRLLEARRGTPLPEGGPGEPPIASDVGDAELSPA